MTNNNNNGYQCPECPRSFKTKHGVKIHIARTHDRKRKKKKTMPPPLKRRKPKPEE